MLCGFTSALEQDGVGHAAGRSAGVEIVPIALNLSCAGPKAAPRVALTIGQETLGTEIPSGGDRARRRSPTAALARDPANGGQMVNVVAPATGNVPAAPRAPSDTIVPPPMLAVD